MDGAAPSAPFIYYDLIQGSDEWRAARCGLLTASEMHHITTPAMKPAKNEKMRAHAYELLAQRLTGYVEPSYISDDMLRGDDDEIDARALYTQKYAPVKEVGFIVRDFGGFHIGYSPDGLVGAEGVIECKGRRAKHQIGTIVSGEMPPEYAVQVQTGLLVSGRKWCDFISYSSGLPMAVYRVEADDEAHDAILAAAEEFEAFIAGAETAFKARASTLHSTVRRVEQEMIV